MDCGGEFSFCGGAGSLLGIANKSSGSSTIAKGNYEYVNTQESVKDEAKISTCFNQKLGRKWPNKRCSFPKKTLVTQLQNFERDRQVPVNGIYLVIRDTLNDSSFKFQ